MMHRQGQVPGGDAPLTFGSVSVETIKEMVKILIFADINGQIISLSTMADL